MGNQLILKLYRQLLVGMSFESHENLMLERSWIGEFASSSSSSTYAEILLSPNHLLDGD